LKGILPSASFLQVGKTYTDAETGAFLKASDLTTKQEDGSVVVTATGKKPRVSWEKMSKSKFNGVDPHVRENEIFFSFLFDCQT
jgi:hypothetical protein